MIKKVVVGVSNRHLHLTKEVFEQLFGKDELTIKAPIKQVGQYAAEETVTIKSNACEIENVRIVGPFRKYNQVEISKTDTFKLKVNAPIRRSGDLQGAGSITLIGPNGSVDLDDCVIIADRHIHITPKEAEEWNLKENDKITAIIRGEKPGTIEVNARVSDEAFLEINLDTDDANAFLIRNDDELEIEI